MNFLFKLSLSFAMLFLYGNSDYAQTLATKNFIIKGNVKHTKEKFWEFVTTGFYGNTLTSLPIDDKGNFLKTIALNSPQDLYLYLNDDAITIFAIPGDTLTVNWDAQDFKSTFTVKAQNQDRQKELDLMLQIYQNYRAPTITLMKELYDTKVSDVEKIDKIEKLYNGYLTTIESYGPLTNSSKIIADVYYTFLDEFVEKINNNTKKMGQGSYTQYKLSVPNSLGQFFPAAPIERLIDENLFLISPQYREYITTKTRFNSAFNSIIKTVAHQKEPDTPNSTLNDCYNGLASLYQSKMIKDWYLVSALMFGYEYYGFDNSEIAYQKFKSEIGTAEYSDTLEKFHSNVQRLKSGNKAPEFQLKDNKGQTVSLSDFEGKIVYIDFWGVHCGPCISDISEFATKVHEKYKDVIFINICVDVDESEWKKSLKELKLEGINLMAKGWIQNPVCKDYGVNGIPHYVLIDKQGKMVNNSAPRLFELANDTDNELDLLIKQPN
jgi:peroxiredoxin